MATQVQRRRGTTAQHAAFIGALGETTFDTTLNRPVVHNGVLAGGFPSAMLHLAQTFAEDQTFAKRILLPDTISAAVGGVYFGGSLAFHNFGSNNTFAGVNAGNLTMTGSYNSFFGTTAGIANTTASSNSFFGANAGAANLGGSGNSFFGRRAGTTNTTGNNNSFFGTSAGRYNTTATNNSFFWS